MATIDSFSLHGFIDCFNHHIDHAALLQSNENEKVGNMILKKVYFLKSNKISKQVWIHISVFILSQEKMFNNNTI